MSLEIPPHPKNDAIMALVEFLTGGQNGYHSICCELGEHHRGPAKRFFDLKRKLIGEHCRDDKQAFERISELLK